MQCAVPQEQHADLDCELGGQSYALAHLASFLRSHGKRGWYQDRIVWKLLQVLRSQKFQIPNVVSVKLPVVRALLFA